MKRSTIMETLWREKYSLGPIILSHVILIGLITYRLIKTNELSEDEKKKISYAEILLSFIASLFILYLIFFTFLMFGLSIQRNPSINMLGFLFYPLLFLLLTPFSLTAFRVGLQDKLSTHQDNILSGLVILSTLIYGRYTIGISIGG